MSFYPFRVMAAFGKKKEVVVESSYADVVNASGPLATRNLTLTSEDFNGSTSYPIGDASVSDAISISNNFTLEGVVSLSSLATDGTVIGLFSLDNRQCLLWFDEGGVPNFRGIFRTSEDQNGALTPESPSGYSVTATTEYHVVYSYNEINGKLYVNGSEVASVPETRIIKNPSAGYEIGDDTGNSRFLTGTGRGFAIYDRALSQIEITEHFNASGVV